MHFTVDSPHNAEAETTPHFLVIGLDFDSAWCSLLATGRVVHSRGDTQMTKLMFRVLGVVASLAVGGAASAADSTPAVEWKVSDGGNGHWYQALTLLTTRTNALKIAADSAAYLTTITSAAENQFLADRNFESNGGNNGYWIGGIRTAPGSGSWSWITGEPWTYSNFDSGEPNGCCGSDVRYTVFRTYQDHAGKWDDTSTENVQYVLLEFSADCNEDGVVDYGQIQSGELADTNHNNIPDVCELVITSVQPISGPSTGGTTVKINGNNFPISPIVTFGGVAATDIVRVTPSLITAVTPAGTPGMTLVAVNSASSESFYYRPSCDGDLDNNGTIDSSDLGLLLINMGDCSSSLTTPQEQEPLIFQTTQTPVPNKK